MPYPRSNGAVLVLWTLISKCPRMGDLAASFSAVVDDIYVHHCQAPAIWPASVSILLADRNVLVCTRYNFGRGNEFLPSLAVRRPYYNCDG